MLSAAEIASMTSVVASSLDTTMTRQRKTTTSDSYGHKTETWGSSLTVSVNVMHPSAMQLQAFAGIIGTQEALLIRFLATTDILEGDRMANYLGKNWLVQYILKAESYSFSNNGLITSIQ